MTPRFDAAAGAALAFVSPVAVWWLVGDLSFDGPDLDYAVQPLPLAPGTERALGLGALALAALAFAVLLRPAGVLWRRPGWWAVLLPVTAAAVVVGAGWRVATAGVYGANIGFGLVVIVGGPVVATCLAFAAYRATRLLRTER